MGRPAGSLNKDKPFREALRMEAALADKNEPSEAFPGSLRYIARKLLERAAIETAAAKEVGDRLDGRPAQAIIGGDDDDQPVLVKIVREIVEPNALPQGIEDARVNVDT